MAEASIPGHLLQDTAPWPITNSLRMNIQTKGMHRYPAKAHAQRVAEKLGVEKGIISLNATKNVNWPNSDMPAPFRQDRYFYYLTGCNEPDCNVTYNIEEDRLTLWLPPVDDNPRHVVYYGNGSTVEEAMEKYDIDEAKYITKPQNIKNPIIPKSLESSILGKLGNTLQLGPGLEPMNVQWVPPPTHDYRDVIKAPIISLDLSCDPDSTSTGAINLRAAMHACRVIKDEYEIDLIRKANDITAEAHVSAFKGMHKFTGEAEIEAAYMQVCIARRAKEQAYDPIVGSGSNASVLHYSENLADFGNGQTVVLDAGCEVECYASDVTRTIPINKKNPGYWPSKEAKAIYDLVEKVQEACIKQMRPGHKYIHSTWTAHMLTIKGLVELGIIQQGHNQEELLLSGVSQYFLPHGLGHHVGLEVHDVSPDPPPPAHQTRIWTTEEVDCLRQAYIERSPTSASRVAYLTKPEQFGISSSCHMSVDSPDAPVLEPGMVVTIEPGIYFSKFLMKALLGDEKLNKLINKDVLERYIPVGGVRIEDDILITKSGYENLTTAPKGEAMLKIIRESASKMF